MKGITVQLNGKPHYIHRILTAGDKNTKLKKNSKKRYRTYGLSLAPAKQSGFEVCPHSSEGCRSACLFTSGFGGIYSAVLNGRKARTIALFKHREQFCKQLLWELGLAVKLAKRKGEKLAIRLNVFSDIPWEQVLPEIFTLFPTIQFYDYTKNFARYMRFLKGDFPKNYHLTFSRSELNEDKCLEILKSGGNVTVVFDVGYQNRWQHLLPPLPKEWKGYEVINGDETDLRFLDKSGVVVGLFAKRTKGNPDGRKRKFLVVAA